MVVVSSGLGLGRAVAHINRPCLPLPLIVMLIQIGPVFYFVFVIFGTFILVNIFIALLSHFYEEMKARATCPVLTLGLQATLGL